jgi:hypothetical protein
LKRHGRKWLPGVDEDTSYVFAIPILYGNRRRRKAAEDRKAAAAALRRERRVQPSLREKAVAFARHNGVVRTKELGAIGIPRCYLARMCEEGLLEKVGYGLYRATAKAA